MGFWVMTSVYADNWLSRKVEGWRGHLSRMRRLVVFPRVLVGEIVDAWIHDHKFMRV